MLRTEAKNSKRRWLSGATVLALIAAAAGLGRMAAWAQQPAATDAPAQTPVPPAATTPAPAQPPAVEYAPPTEADIALMKRTVQSFRTVKPLQVVSDMKMAMGGQGLAITIPSNARIVAASAEKFRSEISVTPPGGGAPVRYLVVSDGRKRVTYRPGTKQYAVEKLTGRGAKEEGPDFFATGLLFGMVGTSGGNNFGDFSALNKAGGKIEVGTERVAEQEYRVYRLTAPNRIGFRVFVEPTAARIDRMEMTAHDDKGGMDVTITEQVTRQGAASPPPAAGAFQFTPPPGSRKVPKISIGTF
jgi:hypothetical protein